MKRILTSISLAVSLVAFCAPSFAGNFAKNHPRRAEVIRRERNEIRKNKEAYKEGKITKSQEQKLNREDRAIYRQEQADAAANGGHITRSEQRDLNREENRVNRERSKMENRDAAQKPAQPAGN